MKTPLLLSLLFVTVFHSFSQNNIGIFENSQNIGSNNYSVSATYNTNNQTYTIKTGNSAISEMQDENHFLYNNITGDFILTADFEFESIPEENSKIGWMVKASEEDNSFMCSGYVNSDGSTALEWREQKENRTENPDSTILAPKRYYQTIQLERSGNTFIMRAAHSGEPLQIIGTKSIESMPDDVLAGINVSSPVEDIAETIKIWNVRIDHPVPDNYRNANESYPGCRIETMNVFDGIRKVIYNEEGHFEAPNWMPNGEKLLFNMDGSLYTISLIDNKVEQLNTGSATRINNDHCISFDGQMIGISNSSDGGSNVYIMPIEGGEPEQITTETPSYLHGWAPNNKELVYVAQRNGIRIYDIYKKSIDGSPEEKLTSNKEYEHVDGCEYSPDGNYIYYNGSKNGGTMNIWRMKPDGSEKEQLTFDEYNDWFPHISPDGKWMVFISFPPDIRLNAHPGFKRVMLRMMPTSGGAPKVIAYLYGGQGTINVNSWSPDSQHISFVSNSGD